MRVLITNNALDSRAGSELYARDLALELIKRGHTPIAYSTRLGEVAEEMRAATVPVIDDLDAMAIAPDIIHCQHHVEAMTALLRFPGVPAVFFCHGWTPWEEAPPIFPRILRYVAVDLACRDRLLFEHAIAEDRIRVLLNFVDLEKFLPREPLPASPRRALLFSSYASEQTCIPVVREACARAGLTLDVIGSLAGNAKAHPEESLREYDIVLAKGRSAIEALAVGAAVILFDATGTGPMVTAEEFDRLRSLNFGIRAIRRPLDAEMIAREIARYDPQDAGEVSRRIRSTAGRTRSIDEIISLYEEVISEYKGEDDLKEEERAASNYLRWLSPRLKEREQLHLLIAKIRWDNAQLNERLAAREAELERINGTFGWRLLKRYGPIKHRFVLPVWNRIKKPFAR
ncbi:MAG: glycosyltransferase [Acidobacteriota bacterium]